MTQYADVIYGGISSSGTVQAFKGYPQWYIGDSSPSRMLNDNARYYTIQENAPQDCIHSVEDIMDK
jgi:hypothetical protein